MEKDPFVSEKHIQRRNFLRIGGIVLIVIGIICIITGFTSTFMTDPFEEFSNSPSDFSFNMDGNKVEFYPDEPSSPGEKFWLMFVGMPMLAIGAAMTKAGFAGEIAEYGARELAPIAKETLHYIKETPTNTIHKNNVVSAIECTGCRSLNPMQAKFCNSCGEKL